MIDQSKTNSDLPHKVYAFFQANTTFEHPSQTIIISSEPHPTDIFCLESGIVKQTITTPKGQELCLNLYKPGSFFPLLDVMTGIANVYTFTALTPIKGWKAPAASVKEFLSQNPDVLLDLNVRLLKGLHGMLLRTEKMMQGDAQSLVAQTIMTMSMRFPSTNSSTPQIAVPMTHQLLADATGLSRETVTRELTKLRAAGVIEIAHHIITITNEATLYQICQTVTPVTVI